MSKFIFSFFKNSNQILYQVNASDVIILEGILVFHDQRVRNLMNMKIFVDTGLLPFHLVVNNHQHHL
jgi:uridine kinase